MISQSNSNMTLQQLVEIWSKSIDTNKSTEQFVNALEENERNRFSQTYQPC